MNLQVRTPEGGSPAHQDPPHQEVEEEDAAKGGSQSDAIFVSIEEPIVQTREEEDHATEQKYKLWQVVKGSLLLDLRVRTLLQFRGKAYLLILACWLRPL